MKYLFAGMLVLHGFIHALGFAQAFRIGGVSQIRVPISPQVGMLWLLAGVLLVGSAVLVFLLPTWWWIPAGLGVVLSQGLIISAWGDARYGTIANLVVLVPVVIAALAHAPWGFHAQYTRDVNAALATAPAEVPVVTEADLARLPAAVQRYLAFCGVVGRPQVWNYQLHLDGALRNGPDDAWMPVQVDQQSFAHVPERLFLVDSTMFGVPTTGYHRYIGPDATFQVNVAGLVNVVDARGPEMNHSETVTLFNDMVLFAPATLIDRRIVWEEIDANTVRATFTNAGQTISAVLTFAADGALTNFVSDDRARTIDGRTFERVRWSTPVSAWSVVDGVRVPVAEARWQLPAGEFTYARFAITDIAYNVQR